MSGPMYLIPSVMLLKLPLRCHMHAGVYPFAGKEGARALALMSTELSDCNDNVDDLSYVEKETLRDWKLKFNGKYPIIGTLVKA